MTMKRAERVSKIISVVETIAKKLEKMDVPIPADSTEEIVTADGHGVGLLGEILEGSELLLHMGTKPNSNADRALAEALCFEIDTLPKNLMLSWGEMKTEARQNPVNKTDLLLSMYDFIKEFKGTKLNCGHKGRPPMVFTAK